MIRFSRTTSKGRSAVAMALESIVDGISTELGSFSSGAGMANSLFSTKQMASPAATIPTAPKIGWEYTARQEDRDNKHSNTNGNKHSLWNVIFVTLFRDKAVREKATTSRTDRYDVESVKNPPLEKWNAFTTKRGRVDIIDCTNPAVRPLWFSDLIGCLFASWTIYPSDKREAVRRSRM